MSLSSSPRRRKSTNVLSASYASADALNEFSVHFGNMRLHCSDYSLIETKLHGVFEVPQKVGYEMLRSYCTKINRPDLVGRCVIDYVSHNQFQAYATSHNFYYFIGISAAVPALLQTMFHNLFSFTNPFAHIYNTDTDEPGDGNLYVFPDRLMARGFGMHKLRSEIDSLLKDTIPDERWKRIMTSKLAELSICFCIAQEIGHLVSGHTEIVKNRAIHAIEEAPIRKLAHQKEIGSWLSQSFEIQADRIGMAL